MIKFESATRKDLHKDVTVFEDGKIVMQFCTDILEELEGYLTDKLKGSDPTVLDILVEICERYLPSNYQGDRNLFTNRFINEFYLL